MHQRPVFLGAFALSSGSAQAAESCAGRTPTVRGRFGDGS